MELDRYVELVATEGRRLRAAAQADLSADVPSCPGWTVRDVVRHTAEVYEHKVACAELGGTKPDPWPPQWPEDADPLEWFDDAHRRLLDMFARTDPAAPSWTWWPQDQTAGFWWRRMAHETAMHRADVELAFGAASPIDDELALDGLDELLLLMLEGDWTGDEEPELTGTFGATTTGASWTIRMHADQVEVVAGEVDAAAVATVSAGPSALLLWMSGRAPDDVVSVRGDAGAVPRLRARLARATQ